MIDLSRFDPDVWPAIDVSHNPPLIARTDEQVKLDFDFMCGYMLRDPHIKCQFKKALFYAFGENNDFSSIPLELELRQDSSSWIATLPATNAEDERLRYYLQVYDPQVGLNVRFPTGGTCDLFTVDKFISIDIPEQKPVEKGERILLVPWGSNQKSIGKQKRDGYPWREGPLAMDISADGRIAFIDYVNERVLIYDPYDQSFSNIPLPFTLKIQGDIQFDEAGNIAIFDPVGESIDDTPKRILHLYILQPDGRIKTFAPVFVSVVGRLMEDLTVFDYECSRIIVPFSPSGEVNSREVQRMKQPARYRVKYMPTTVNDVRLADTERGIDFALHSESPLGAIIYFEQTPQGYVAIFHANTIRAVWFNPTGNVLKDITVPNDQYTDFSPHGQVYIDKSGSLYIMGTIKWGTEVRFVKAP